MPRRSQSCCHRMSSCRAERREPELRRTASTLPSSSSRPHPTSPPYRERRRPFSLILPSASIWPSRRRHALIARPSIRFAGTVAAAASPCRGRRGPKLPVLRTPQQPFCGRGLPRDRARMHCLVAAKGTARHRSTSPAPCLVARNVVLPLLAVPQPIARVPHARPHACGTGDPVGTPDPGCPRTATWTPRVCHMVVPRRIGQPRGCHVEPRGTDVSKSQAHSWGPLTD